MHQFQFTAKPATQEYKMHWNIQECMISSSNVNTANIIR